MRGPYNYHLNYSSMNMTLPRKRVERKTWYRTDFRQKVRTPLPYDHCVAEAVSGRLDVLNYFPCQFGAHAPVALVANAHTAIQGHASTDFTWLYNKTVAKWHDKARLRVQFGVDYAERKQLADTLIPLLKAARSPLKSLGKLVERYTKKGGTQRALGDIPGAYLAYHFGIEPLQKEIHELMERYLEHRKTATLVTASTSTTRYEGRTSSNGGGSYVYQRHSRTSLRIAGVIQEKEGYDALIQLDRYGLVNPASIAWELVPYSFVVDWFLPIGLWIDTAFGSMPGYSFKNGYRTLYSTMSSQEGVDYTDKLMLGTGATPTVNVKSYWCGRTLLSSFPVAEFTTQLNPWSQSMTRLKTALSLLAQLRK